MRLAFLLLTLSLYTVALAHDEQTVGEGQNQYTVIFGMASEPAYTDEHNGIDLTVEDAEGHGVENLAASLSASITAPDGSATRDLTLRPVYNEPGSYTSDLVLTEPGVYSVTFSGLIGETDVDVTFQTHEIAPLTDLNFP